MFWYIKACVINTIAWSPSPISDMLLVKRVSKSSAAPGTGGPGSYDQDFGRRGGRGREGEWFLQTGGSLNYGCEINMYMNIYI